MRWIYNKTLNILWQYSSLGEAFEFCWSSFSDEHNTLTKSTMRNVKLNKFAFGNPWLPDSFKTLIYIISMEFLSLSHRRSSSQKVPSHEEQGETSVSAGSQKIGDVIYQAWDAVFHHQMEHWEESWKYDAQRSIFDELPGDIISQTKWF